MSIRVLLVDDVADVRRLVRVALRFRGGFDVIGEARAGQEAVELAAALRPDIVLLDLGL
ncbi:MAG TPA: response regulator, partial [Nocardioides sp.]|nr:response regulator [Nocardioides sp.]